MINKPLLQIAYQPDAVRRRLLISPHDRQLLTKLAARDIWVTLACSGEDTYWARVQVIRAQLRFDPQMNQWGIPIALSASLLRAS
jgi:hypothetical protein